MGKQVLKETQRHWPSNATCLMNEFYDTGILCSDENRMNYFIRWLKEINLFQLTLFQLNLFHYSLTSIKQDLKQFLPIVTCIAKTSSTTKMCILNYLGATDEN